MVESPNSRGKSFYVSPRRTEEGEGANIKRALSLPKIQLNIKRVLRLFSTRSRTCVAFKGRISRYLR